MATRLIEHLNANSDDQNTVRNWISRLESAMEIALFTNADQLPTDEGEKTTMVNSLKKNYLLSCIGPVGYQYLKSYCAPAEPSTKSYVELIKLLQDNLAPTPNKIAEEYKFTLLKQESGESLSSFYSRVKNDATTCDFGDKYDHMVRNRFIYGLRDTSIRKSLLSADDKLTAQQVFDKAVAKERASLSNQNINVSYVNRTSRQDSSQGSPASSSKSSNRNRANFSQSNNNDFQITCSKCTMKGHTQANCRVRCRYCKKPGHIAKHCVRGLKNKRDVRQVEDEPNEQLELEEESYDSFPGAASGSVGMYFVDARELKHVELDICDGKVGNSPCHKPKGNELGSSSKCTKLVSSMEKSSVELGSDINCNYSSDPSQMFRVGKSRKPALRVMLNGKYVYMEVDTGAAVSCISRRNFDMLNLTGVELASCHVNLCVANGHIVKSFCKATVTVKFREFSCKLPLYVVESEFPTLLGIEWIQAMFGENWLSRLIGSCWSVNQVSTRQSFIDMVKSSGVFKPGIGIVQGFEARIDLKPGARPKFYKARPPPFAYREGIGKKLDALEKDGVLKRVDHSDYASPIQTVVKDDGDLRICGDYKRTLNPNIDTKVYPLPVIEDCLWDVRGGELYTKLDIKQAYNHLPLRESDQELTTVNTHKGLYKWLRLPYGVSSASAIFQSVMDQLLEGIKGVTCRVDDILITGPNDEQHMIRVREVIGRLEKAGFRCRMDKSQFMEPSVVYLGHEVSKYGIRPVSSKVETLTKARYPKSREDLISFLGAIQK